MKYLKKYNEQVKYLSEIDTIDDNITKLYTDRNNLKGQYKKILLDCVLYISDMSDVVTDVQYPMEITKDEYFHLKFQFRPGLDKLYNELVDNIRSSIMRLKNEVNADDISVSINVDGGHTKELTEDQLDKILTFPKIYRIDIKFK